MGTLNTYMKNVGFCQKIKVRVFFLPSFAIYKGILIISMLCVLCMQNLYFDVYVCVHMHVCMYMHECMCVYTKSSSYVAAATTAHSVAVLV